MRAPDPTHYAFWLMSRAAGVVAMLLVTASVLIGLTMAAKIVRRRGMGPWLLRIHEQTALAGLAFVGIHGVSLLGDRWLRPGVAGIAVPFAMSYRPLFTGFGIVAGYLAALLGLSFYVRRQIGPRLWRKLHRATVLVWILGVVHSLGAGTDAGSTWLRVIVLGSAIPVVVLFGLRATRGRRMRSRRARTAAPPPRRRVLATWES